MNYIALTIGPIYKTLQNAKKPKELWSGSYLFSYIMKNIIKEFQDREFITPYIEDSSIFAEKSEVGLFHDRFIFKSKENDVYKLKSVIDDVLSNVAQKLNIKSSSIKNYMQINYDEYSLEDDKNPITEIMPYLDTKELFFKLTHDENENFYDALKSKDNFLLDGKNIVDDLKKLTYHSYYCVIHADGDNMSKVIQDKSNIKDVSKKLFEYCSISHKLIKEFGGQTIFAGGDDLLFFAPVVNRQGDKSIFNLCDEISKDFEERFNSVATLSFGITINYVKFPLYEALENSREMLFSKAKSGKKNNIAFKVTKHSGQSFESIVHKNDKEVYEKFLNFASNIATTEDTNFLHSIHHKIQTYTTTLNEIIEDKQKLQNFFDNYFNETKHDEYKMFFKTLIDFIHTSKDLEQVYATLRFIKFIKGDKK